MQEYTDVDAIDEFNLARTQFDYLIERLSSKQYQAKEFADIEATINEEGFEIMRLLLQGHLDCRSHKEEKSDSVIGKDNIKRTHCRPNQKRSLMTVFGEVEVHRYGYRAKEISTCFPMDAEMNLSKDKYSPMLRQKLAKEVAKGSFDEAVESINQGTGGKVPKRQAQELSQRVSQDFDEYYKQKPVIKSKDLLVMSVDGKGIVVRHQDLRPATKAASEKSTHKLETRLSRGEKRNRKRMATVAAVYDIAPNQRTAESILGLMESEEPEQRPKPENKRVWASLQQDSSEVIEQMFQEALRRDPKNKRTWLILVDGQEHQLKVIEETIARHEVNAVVIQDFVHALEYLWKAAYCFYDEGSAQAEQWVKEKALSLLHGDVSNAAAGMRRSATKQALSQRARKPVDKCADYLLKNKLRFDYGVALLSGWPIATGVIEGACRYLVKDRMDITGARWSVEGAEAVLRLRALHAGGDFDEYMEYHQLCEWRRNYEVRAAA